MKLVRTGDPNSSVLDGKRLRVDGLKKETDQVQRARVPLEEMRTRLDRAVDRLIGQTAPDQNFAGFQSAIPFSENLPALGFQHLIFLFGKDDVVDRILAKFQSDDRSAGLPAAEREARIKELQTQLRDAEREEEIEVLRLEAAGYTVLRRADADVALLLEIWANLPAPQSEPAAAPA